jgi:hypothetical protein
LESDELSHLAALTGYSDEPVTPQVSNSPSPLLDPEDFEPDPVPTTQQPLWSNPWAKAGFVGSGLALLIGLVALFLHSVQGPTGTPVAETETTPVAETVPLTALPPDADAEEIGRLKTVGALGTQTQALKAEKAQPVAAAPTTVSLKAVTTTPAPMPPAPTSRPTPAYTPPPTYSTPVRSNSVAPAPPLSSPPAVRTNPVEQWQTAVALGSYGQVSYDSGTTAIAPPPSNTSAGPKADTTSQVRYEADAAAILSGIPSQVASILAGSQAAATLSTPVVWAQDLDNTQQPQRFGLQLIEPLLAADGVIALPAGTQLVTQVDTISSSGLVQLSVIAVVRPSPSGNQVVPVPPGALLIQGTQGNPLMASQYNTEGDRLAGLDAGVALMGALSQVGEILNRPTSQTSTGSVFYSSSTTTNPAPNILGAALEGGFDALHEQVSERQEQQIEAILSRPHVWYIPAGQPVQVFTGTSFEVAL